MTYQEVEQSKIFVGDGKFNFPHPCQLVDPFLNVIERLGGSITYEAVKGSENLNQDTEERNIAFSRLAVKVKMPEEYSIVANDLNFNHLYGEIGFVYGFDTQKPTMKVYRGARVSVCTNLSVFGADNLTEVLFTSSHKTLFDNVRRYVDTSIQDNEKIKEIIDELSGTLYVGTELNELIGRIHRESVKITRLGVTPICDAVKYLSDSKSRYYAQNDTASGWIVYNAMTESIKRCNILDEASKSLLLERIFLNNN